MQFKIITVPFEESKNSFLEDDLNGFVLNKQIKEWKAEFFMLDGKAFWSVFLAYEPVLGSASIPDQLSESEQLLYKRLREWRKQRAESDGVPVFIIANNSELVSIIKKAPKTIDALKLIRGFGGKKVEKYGKEIVELVQKFYGTKK